MKKFVLSPVTSTKKPNDFRSAFFIQSLGCFIVDVYSKQGTLTYMFIS